MTAPTNDQAIEELRSVLLGSDREAMSSLTETTQQLAAHLTTVTERQNSHDQKLSEVSGQVHELNDQLTALQAMIAELSERVGSLQQLVESPDDRAQAVGEVLIDALSPTDRDVAGLGKAMQPEVEHALHVSARTDSVVLAEALYPVMGPALRKMIAEIFTFGDGKSKASSFQVSEVLLLERASGVLLAQSPNNPDNEDSAVVSGMLDAIRLFVEEAFDSAEHDGLQDLRVGDTSILVEWGPKALLASVAKGIPSPDYRAKAAATLEQIHLVHASDLETFTGAVAVFDPAEARLSELRTGTHQSPLSAARSRIASPLVVSALLLIALIAILLIVLL